MTCPCRKLYPDVLVMQTAQDGECVDGTAALDRTYVRRVLAERQVRAACRGASVLIFPIQIF